MTTATPDTYTATAYLLKVNGGGQISFVAGGSYRSFDSAVLDAKANNDLIGHLGFRYFALTAKDLQELLDSGVYVHVA